MTLQKKSYKALLALCSSASEAHAKFVCQNIEDIQVRLYTWKKISVNCCILPSCTLPILPSSHSAHIYARCCHRQYWWTHCSPHLLLPKCIASSACSSLFLGFRFVFVVPNVYNVYNPFFLSFISSPLTPAFSSPLPSH